MNFQHQFSATGKLKSYFQHSLSNLPNRLWPPIAIESTNIRSFFEALTPKWVRNGTLEQAMAYSGCDEGLSLQDFQSNGHKQVQKLNISHVGCSNGEDVFSLGILLKEPGCKSRVEALATDFKKKAIEEAKLGVRASLINSLDSSFAYSM